MSSSNATPQLKITCQNKQCSKIGAETMDGGELFEIRGFRKLASPFPRALIAPVRRGRGQANWRIRDSRAPKNHRNRRLYTRVRNFTAFMLSTCVKLLQSLRYFGFHFTQVPHTYAFSQPLSSHVSLSRNRHRRIAEIDVYKRRLDISLFL
jgi:hypothetical protein